MVYTKKKERRKAKKLRVFLHEKYVLFTMGTDGAEERGLHNHHRFEYLYNIKVRLQFSYSVRCLQ